MKTKDYDVALKMGTAAGSATAFSDGLAQAADIDALYKTL
jgi:1-phosphofructokinase